MKGSHIFSQILQRIDWNEFNRIVKKHNGDIVLLLVYAKAKFDQLRPELLLKIKEKYDV